MLEILRISYFSLKVRPTQINSITVNQTRDRRANIIATPGLRSNKDCRRKYIVPSRIPKPAGKMKLKVATVQAKATMPIIIKGEKGGRLCR